jgi:signal transduction histidine kinase
MRLKILTKITLLLFGLILAKPLNAQHLDSLFVKTQVHLDHYELDSAEYTINLLEKRIPNRKASAELCNFYRIKADLFSKRNELNKQFEYKKLALEVAEKLQNNLLLADVYSDLAIYHESVYEIKTSIPYLLKALEIYNAEDKKDKLALIYNKLGLLYYDEDNYKLAHTYFFGSFVIFNAIKNQKPEYAYWVQNNLLNIGLCYQMQFQPQKALAYFKLALAFCQNAAFEQERPIGVISTNIGAIYGELKNYPLAYEYLFKGLKICLNPRNDELYHGVQTIIFIASLKSSEGKYKEADEYFNQAKHKIDSLGFSYMNEYRLYQLSKHYARQKKYELAYHTRLSHLSVKDSILKASGRNTLSRQMLVYKLGKEKAENELLLEQNNNHLLITIGISLLLILFILSNVVGYYFFKKIRANNANLVSLNQQIMQQKFALEALNHELHDASENKTFLIKTIAHDLRTPIGNLMSLQGLLDEYIQKSPESEEYQKLISSSCFMAMHIIEDILDQSVIEKGILQLSKESIPLNPIIKDAIQLLRFRVEPKQIQIVTLFEDEVTLNIDGERIKRVIINILMNAIKFSPRKSAIHIKLSQKLDKCYLSIADQGVGMAQEVVNKLFDKKQKKGALGLEKEKSFGIGLTIAQSIIEAHGGNIFVESKLNYGSTFYIELPLNQP